ncbi:MAG TPA: DUF975 family protein [bacterium]|nr:DUF975 family protein [bacterium]
MAEGKVEVGKAIGYGWENVKKEFWYFVGLAFVVVVISGIGNSRDIDSGIRNIIGLLLSAWMTAGYMKILLSYYDGKKLPFGELFKQLRYFWRVLGLTLLLGLVIGIGFILFVIPGIYLALRYQFALNFIIDKDLGIFEAMNESAKITKGVKLSLFWFMLAVLGVLILGVLVLGVGIFVAIPVVWLADVYLYKQLSK